MHILPIELVLLLFLLFVVEGDNTEKHEQVSANALEHSRVLVTHLKVEPPVDLWKFITTIFSEHEVNYLAEGVPDPGK